jgi:hypothetical protein
MASGEDLVAIAAETAPKLAAKAAGALRGSKPLILHASLNPLRERLGSVEAKNIHDRPREGFTEISPKRRRASPPNSRDPTTT